MSNLTRAILRLPAKTWDSNAFFGEGPMVAYAIGQRDARYAAAELASEQDVLVYELVAALRGMASMWRTVCNSKGWEPDHMQQHKDAIAVLAKLEQKT